MKYWGSRGYPNISGFSKGIEPKNSEKKIPYIGGYPNFKFLTSSLPMYSSVSNCGSGRLLILGKKFQPGSLIRYTPLIKFSQICPNFRILYSKKQEKVGKRRLLDPGRLLFLGSVPARMLIRSHRQLDTKE